VLQRRGHALDEGIGMAAALQAASDQLPGVEHGNFTRPVAAPSASPAGV
jgi:hypothetical protein